MDGVSGNATRSFILHAHKDKVQRGIISLSACFGDIVSALSFCHYALSLSFHDIMLGSIILRSSVHPLQSPLLLTLLSQITVHCLPTAPAKSARASFRLNRASSITPASASDEKCADHCTKVDPSFAPDVTAKQRTVEMTLEYVNAGVDAMTE